MQTLFLPNIHRVSVYDYTQQITTTISQTKYENMIIMLMILKQSEVDNLAASIGK